MFTKLEPLEKTKHQALRFSKSQDFSFSNNTSAVQLSFSEIPQACQYYPIVFPKDGVCLPMALLGIAEGENAYATSRGEWKVPYIPFSIRMYPFTLVKTGAQEETFALCIDPDAPHFASGMGDPMFTADGEANEFTQGILKALTQYQKEIAGTQALFAVLADKELIVDRKIEFNVNGTKRGIDGFKGVDMEKLITMDDAFLANLVRKGTLSLVYSHLQSLSKFGLLFQKNESTASGS
nr:SapC family protein [uncultured Desulfobacter sp.]